MKMKTVEIDLCGLHYQRSGLGLHMPSARYSTERDAGGGGVRELLVQSALQRDGLPLEPKGGRPGLSVTLVSPPAVGKCGHDNKSIFDRVSWTHEQL